MTARIHDNGLSALKHEIDKTACRNKNDPREVERSQALFAEYIASHLARLKAQKPLIVLTMDILTKNIASECGPAATEIFRQYLIIFFRAIELSEMLPDPRTTLECLSSEQTKEIITRVSKP